MATIALLTPFVKGGWGILLQTALADEYLAALQYHLGTKLARNAKLKKECLVAFDNHSESFCQKQQKELAQHAKEELHHADLLVRRIIVLDGTPAPKSMWETLSPPFPKGGRGDFNIFLRLYCAWQRR